MKSHTKNIYASVNLFIDALHRYELASQKMQRSLLRLNTHTIEFCEPLSRIIHTTSGGVSSRRAAADQQA